MVPYRTMSVGGVLISLT